MLLMMLQQTSMMKLQQKLLQKNVTANVANDVLADPVDALFPLWKRFQLRVSCCTRSYLDVVANTANFVIKKLL